MKGPEQFNLNFGEPEKSEKSEKPNEKEVLKMPSRREREETPTQRAARAHVEAKFGPVELLHEETAENGDLEAIIFRRREQEVSPFEPEKVIRATRTPHGTWEAQEFVEQKTFGETLRGHRGAA